MTVQQKLFMLTLQLRCLKIISSIKTKWRLMYPTNMWSYLMLQGALVLASLFGVVLVVSNIFN